MQKDKIKLSICWKWKCPLCGDTIYHSGCEVRDAEVRKDADEFFRQGDETFDGEMVACPVQVGCQKCDTVYEVELENDD